MSVDAEAEATTTRAARRDVDEEREETVRRDVGRRAPATSARAATVDGMDGESACDGSGRVGDEERKTFSLANCAFYIVRGLRVHKIDY